MSWSSLPFFFHRPQIMAQDFSYRVSFVVFILCFALFTGISLQAKKDEVVLVEPDSFAVLLSSIREFSDPIYLPEGRKYLMYFVTSLSFVTNISVFYCAYKYFEPLETTCLVGLTFGSFLLWSRFAVKKSQFRYGYLNSLLAVFPTMLSLCSYSLGAVYFSSPHVVLTLAEIKLAEHLNYNPLAPGVDAQSVVLILFDMKKLASSTDLSAAQKIQLRAKMKSLIDGPPISQLAPTDDLAVKAASISDYLKLSAGIPIDPKYAIYLKQFRDKGVHFSRFETDIFVEDCETMNTLIKELRLIYSDSLPENQLEFVAETMMSISNLLIDNLRNVFDLLQNCIYLTKQNCDRLKAIVNGFSDITKGRFDGAFLQRIQNIQGGVSDGSLCPTEIIQDMERLLQFHGQLNSNVALQECFNILKPYFDYPPSLELLVHSDSPYVKKMSTNLANNRESILAYCIEAVTSDNTLKVPTAEWQKLIAEWIPSIYHRIWWNGIEMFPARQRIIRVIDLCRAYGISNGKTAEDEQGNILKSLGMLFCTPICHNNILDLLPKIKDFSGLGIHVNSRTSGPFGTIFSTYIEHEINREMEVARELYRHNDPAKKDTEYMKQLMYLLVFYAEFFLNTTQTPCIAKLFNTMKKRYYVELQD